MDFPKKYWDTLYASDKTGWDIGSISTPLKEYFDQLTNRNIRILVPGGGKGWEAEYLYKQGFVNTYILDFSEKALAEFKSRCPQFPESNIIKADFFKHCNTYDLIVEQTFFSSFNPKNRSKYVLKVAKLLAERGRYVGLLFNHEFNFERPPFGGSPAEYKELFAQSFDFVVFSTAYNSIAPRTGRELFLLLKKK